MSEYLITVEQVGGSGQIKAVVDLASAGPTVREISVRPDDGGSTVPQKLAALDFRQIVEIASRLSGEAEAPGSVPDIVDRDDMDRDEPAQRIDGGRTSAPADKVPPGRVGKHVSDMPPDFPVRYWKMGSAARVAEHYSVPRQIANGWIKELRRTGKAPDPWRQGRTRGRHA
ncbi:hypothetical protein [Micromonospora sp. NPDC051141]|uniref:hypothetical protein n=1 Tax=Micromonospora sp. NPDC051141 TaxID=3364284 RepID=UPI003788BE28